MEFLCSYIVLYNSDYAVLGRKKTYLSVSTKKLKGVDPQRRVPLTRLAIAGSHRKAQWHPVSCRWAAMSTVGLKKAKTRERRKREPTNTMWLGLNNGATVSPGSLPLTPKLLRSFCTYIKPLNMPSTQPCTKSWSASLTFSQFSHSAKILSFAMEASRVRVFFAVVVMLMAALCVQNVAAAHAPAPSPTSDATVFVPATLASLAALAVGFLF